MKRGLRILLVEDEALIAMTAEDMLEGLGCSVVSLAHSLSAGLEAVEAGGFDLAVLDINLNGEPSLPIAGLLRSGCCPFIFTTGYGAEGAGRDFADVPLVTKPYRSTDLAAAIDRALAAPI